MDYTARIQDYQIRDTVYFPDCKPQEPIREFDIVKWYSHEPQKATNLVTGEKEITTESCYSIAFLKWNEDAQDFDFQSIGMRWLEEEVPAEFCRVIKAFADFKAAEYRSLENECNN